MVSRIASDFCERSLSVRPVTGRAIQPNLQLSPPGKIRVFRPLCRFQPYRNLFAGLRAHDAMDKSFLFLHNFKTWEVAEMACVHEYIHARYERFHQECASGLKKIFPINDLIQVRDRPVLEILQELTPFTEYWRKENIGLWESRGLLLLYHLLNASSAVQKASILQNSMYYDRDFFEEALSEPQYDYVYSTEAYEDGQELLFEDDCLVDGPNAAWPWSTFHKVSFDYFLGHTTSMRKWTYVMWDHGRLEDCGVLELDPHKLFDALAFSWVVLQIVSIQGKLLGDRIFRDFGPR